MRETSNPVFRSLPKQRGGYAQFGTGTAQQGFPADPYLAPYREAKATRPLTIDDVVTKTGLTLAMLAGTAVVSYFLVASNVALAMPLTLVGLWVVWRWCWWPPSAASRTTRRSCSATRRSRACSCAIRSSWLTSRWRPRMLGC